jgi:hypothetical protein
MQSSSSMRRSSSMPSFQIEFPEEFKVKADIEDGQITEEDDNLFDFQSPVSQHLRPVINEPYPKQARGMRNLVLDLDGTVIKCISDDFPLNHVLQQDGTVDPHYKDRLVALDFLDYKGRAITQEAVLIRNYTELLDWVSIIYVY